MNKLFIPLVLMTAFSLQAQIDLEYQTPHEDIMVLADAKPAPAMRMNTEATVGVLMYRNPYKSIEELSETEMRLAGLRINPVTNISSRARYYNNLRIYDVLSKEEHEVSGLPERPKLTNFSWSHDQKMMAFTNTTITGLELWVLDLGNRSAKKLTPPVLNANMGDVINWLKDDSGILVKRLPENRQPLIDPEETVPSGPTVSVNEGAKAQNRTYQDLLKNKIDEYNFEQLATSELWLVQLDGRMTPWKEAAMYGFISISPDGNYVFVQAIHKPFSYIVPYYRFPTQYVIYTIDGTHVKNFYTVPLMEEMPKGFMAVRTGPRSINWRADRPSTLYWAEALDDGDPAKEVEYRDAVYQQKAPFDAGKELLVKTKDRYNTILWGSDHIAVVYDYWWNTRILRTAFFDPADPAKATRVFNERNFQDRYSDPGNFVSRKNDFGRYVLDIDDNNVYLLGDGYSEEGIRPFVDKYELESGKTERLYQTELDDQLETLVNAIDIREGKILARIESKNEYPNYYFRDVKNGALEQVTFFKNPFKAIQDVHKEVIQYKRKDGVELSATLYLPVDYNMEKKEKMPMLMWAYPREFKDKSTAGQVTSSPNEFTYPYYGSPLYWVNRGYVVLDDAAFPIIGEGEEEPNDTFIEQLVANAKAAIDAVDELGYIDRNRVAIGGHSYGAFMTANLLTHSDLFAAGIARSGAYNRTLTPFGFQSEERNYWEAPEVYYEMSPFMHADKMKTPLLLIHGEADNNSGTYPMQSERYFNALKGLGATVRLVILPKESHGYAARESILHMLWEQDQWLEQYLKNPSMNE